ncbi:hypothetical protein BDV25DRAFT_140571 [Aspergillus avenaceus]|uniref:HMG box domain-containing protein n=1 Tax=Aspergillus avenaceus TaxID=36643 RepID=A0A5N6TTF6_ASPAV|nr:hypothetical protein BDV25DRAFT_140571 [Aspergillus avenaceus]
MARRASKRSGAQSLGPTHQLLLAIARVTNSANAAASVVGATRASLPTEAQLTYAQVIVSLAQLQSAVSELSKAYINHANTVLNRGETVEIGSIANITNALYESGLLGTIGGARATSPGAKSDTGDKKKRKRAPPDPNAPKRALTPFFLFMQHNRSKIAEELGSSAKPKDVSDEGTRRWADMPEEEKEYWKKTYADNLAIYKEKMKAYKAGLPYSDDVQAANQLQQEADRAEATAAEESEEEEEEEQEQEQEESSPEPVKEPTPPRTKRRRSETNKAAKEAASPAENKRASPEKKKTTRTPAKKAQEETPASTRKTTAQDKTRGKKKRKSEVAADE